MEEIENATDKEDLSFSAFEYFFSLNLKALKFCLTPFIEFPQWLWKSFKILGNNEKIGFGVFLLTLIIQRLWLSYNTDVIYDEAWTYLAFTSKNPFLAACF